MPKKTEASNGADVVARRSSRLQEKATTAPPPPAKKAPVKKAAAGAKKETAKKPAAKGKKDEEKAEEEEPAAEDKAEETDDKKRKADEEPEEKKDAEPEAPVAAAENGKKPAAKKAKKEEEPAVKEIKEGETVPADLKVTDQEGKEHLVADLTKEHGIVIFFYPKANTPGCTKQACGFRDNYDVLKEKGYEVFGLSSDTAKSQSNWKTKYKLQYTLLTDDHSKALKTFGAFKGGKIVRSHVIIEKGGVVKTKVNQVNPVDCVKDVVAAIAGEGAYKEPVAEK